MPYGRLNRFPLGGGDAGDMSVTVGSLGTADISVSNPSLDGLDRVNFFLAAMLAGWPLRGRLPRQSELVAGRDRPRAWSRMRHEFFSTATRRGAEA